MYKILIIYYNRIEYPLRPSIRDHLYSFKVHSGNEAYYINLAFRNIPFYLSAIEYDLIIFHTTFLSTRWTTHIFDKMVSKVKILKNNNAVKIILPQDEFYNTKALCRFIDELKIDHVFTVSPKTEWKKIYPTVNFEKVKFHQVLTGYLEENTVSKIKLLSKKIWERRIDIGYRSWEAEPWLGSHGVLKTEIAKRFNEIASQNNIKMDISTRREDIFLGDEWFKFLLRCKYTIGVEGGASILDFDGSIMKRTRRYMEKNRHAKFREVEKACFPNMDGILRLFAISPRHLEACATKTCQILIEGNYNGILLPDIHYIPIKHDFTNLETVIHKIFDDKERERITDNAYRDIVESGKWSYQNFVEEIISVCMVNKECKEKYRFSKQIDAINFACARTADQISTTFLCLLSPFIPIFRFIKNIIKQTDFKNS